MKVHCTNVHNIAETRNKWEISFLRKKKNCDFFAIGVNIV